MGVHMGSIRKFYFLSALILLSTPILAGDVTTHIGKWEIFSNFTPAEYGLPSSHFCRLTSTIQHKHNRKTNLMERELYISEIDIGDGDGILELILFGRPSLGFFESDNWEGISQHDTNNAVLVLDGRKVPILVWQKYYMGSYFLEIIPEISRDDFPNIPKNQDISNEQIQTVHYKKLRQLNLDLLTQFAKTKNIQLKNSSNTITYLNIKLEDFAKAFSEYKKCSQIH